MGGRIGVGELTRAYTLGHLDSQPLCLWAKLTSFLYKVPLFQSSCCCYLLWFKSETCPHLMPDMFDYLPPLNWWYNVRLLWILWNVWLADRDGLLEECLWSLQSLLLLPCYLLLSAWLRAVRGTSYSPLQPLSLLSWLCLGFPDAIDWNHGLK